MSDAGTHQLADESVNGAPGALTNSNRVHNHFTRESVLALVLSVLGFCIVVVISAIDYVRVDDMRTQLAAMRDTEVPRRVSDGQSVEDAKIDLYKRYEDDAIRPLKDNDFQVSYWLGQCSQKADALTTELGPLSNACHLGLLPDSRAITLKGQKK